VLRTNRTSRDKVMRIGMGKLVSEPRTKAIENACVHTFKSNVALATGCPLTSNSIACLPE